MKCVICKNANSVPAKNCKSILICDSFYSIIDLSCVCAPGSKRVAPANVEAGRPNKAYLSNFHPTCEECTANTEASNADQSACLSIGSGVEIGSNGEAKCSDEGSYITESDTAFTCAACADGTYPLTKTKCEPCPALGMIYREGKCSCGTQYETAGDICVPRD